MFLLVCQHKIKKAKKKTGDFLFSQQGNSQVSSALKSLTSVFGMGTGISSSLLSPENYSVLQHTQKYIDKYSFSQAKLILWLSPRSISTGQLHTSLYFHLQPINQVVFLESYYLTIWEILSQGGLHTQMLSAFIPSIHSYSAVPLV